jgi:hypothetical protein
MISNASRGLIPLEKKKLCKGREGGEKPRKNRLHVHGLLKGRWCLRGASGGAFQGWTRRGKSEWHLPEEGGVASPVGAYSPMHDRISFASTQSIFFGLQSCMLSARSHLIV